MERLICRVMFSTLILAGTTFSDDGYPDPEGPRNDALAMIIGAPIALILLICCCIYFCCRGVCSCCCGKPSSAHQQTVVNIQAAPQQVPFMPIPQQQVPFMPIPQQQVPYMPLPQQQPEQFSLPLHQEPVSAHNRKWEQF